MESAVTLLSIRAEILEYECEKVKQSMTDNLLTPAGMEVIRDFNFRRIQLETLEVLQNEFHF